MSLENARKELQKATATLLCYMQLKDKYCTPVEAMEFLGKAAAACHACSVTDSNLEEYAYSVKSYTVTEAIQVFDLPYDQLQNAEVVPALMLKDLRRLFCNVVVYDQIKVAVAFPFAQVAGKSL